MLTRTTTRRTVAALEARAAKLVSDARPSTLVDAVRLLSLHGRRTALGGGHCYATDATGRWVRLTRAGGTMPNLAQLLHWLVSAA